jgi:sugar phosphate isomerase/epimerase
VLSTLAQALDVAEHFDPAAVGVVLDSFHLWWDPDVRAQIHRATGRIASVQLADWAVPLPADTLLARAMLGDGVIDLRGFVDATTAAGFGGDIEVEIFNADVWAADGDATVATMVRRYVELSRGGEAS